MLNAVNRTEQTHVFDPAAVGTSECQSPSRGNCRSEEALDLTQLPVLTRISEVVALDENTEALYRGPVPYQGLARFSHQCLLNRILRNLSLRWLLLRELLSSCFGKAAR